MPANDERDPLDRWLGQQVQPLPPPPGTFELITRRARRRKLRKLAVSVAGGAAVAVGIALAVPGGLLLHVNPPSVGGVAAGQNSPTTGARQGTESPNGTGSPAATSSGTPSGSATGPSGPSTPASGPVTEPSGPVPPNFAPTSVTFVSTGKGWAIGQAGTPGQCANKNPYICTSVTRTDDAGKTWVGVPAPETTGPDANGLVAAGGVSQIRFLDGVNGWAYGPGLFVTHDEGNHWQAVNTNGQWVIALETAGDRAFAVWATCPAQSSQYPDNGYVTGCTSYTLMSTPASEDNWQPVGAATTGLTVSSGTYTPVSITLSGTAGYLYLGYPGKPAVYSGPLDGAWQQVQPPPCNAAGGIALAGTTQLAVVCPGRAEAAKPTLWRSGDGGQTWTNPAVSWPEPAPIMPYNQAAWVIRSLAAAPDGTLVLATTSGLYVLPAGSTQWTWTNAAGQGAPDGGFTYVGMTSNDQGVAVPANTSLHEIWMTFDGGQTWAPATPIVPGE